MNDKAISEIDPVGSYTLQVIAKANRFNRWMYAEFRSFLSGNILEIGSGIGNISQLVINDGHYISLSDFNIEYYEWLKKKYTNTDVKEIFQIDLLHPDFATHYWDLHEKFDSIFLLNVIEHIADDAQAIANCRFMLKPEGHLIILAPAFQWLYSNLDKELGHYRRYTIRKMKVILKKERFNIQNIKYFNFLGMWGWFFAGKIFRQKKLGKGEMNAFNGLVPLAKITDKIIFRKAGLSIIAFAVKTNN